MGECFKISVCTYREYFHIYLGECVLKVPAERLYRESVWLVVFTPKVRRTGVTTIARHTEGPANCLATCSQSGRFYCVSSALGLHSLGQDTLTDASKKMQL